jgi:hypothetical protein
VFKSTLNTVAPTANDDSANTNGNGVFQIGDMWVDETADKAYVCVDNTATSAVWVDITISVTDAVLKTGVVSNSYLSFWSNSTTITGSSDLRWTGVTLDITGNITISGTVDGRNVSSDGNKLDGIAAGATVGVTVASAPVDDTPTAFAGITTLNFTTGTGLTLDSSGSNATLSPQLNIEKDTVNRTIAQVDHNSIITNEGAGGTVRWTIPTGLAAPFKVTFLKSSAQTMELIGANTVTINGVTESGGSESLNIICDSQYDSFVTLVRTNINTYTLYTGDVQGNYTFNSQSVAGYTVVLSDNGRIVTMDNVGANTVTLPTNATTAFPIGAWFRVIQVGTGATSIAGDVGVTLNGVSGGSGTISGQWNEVNIYKAATDSWYVTGDIGAVA